MESEKGIEMDIHTACSLGDEDFVVQLLKVGEVDVNAPSRDGWSPLMFAAWGGHDGVARHLLRAGANKQQLSNQRETALHLAAKSGCLHVVTLVFQENILDQIDRNKKTALFYSVELGYLDITSFLLFNGAKVNISCEQTTVLMVAAGDGHGNLVELLLSHGADRAAQNKQGLTAGQLAAGAGHLHLAPLLVLDLNGIRGFLESISMEKYWPVFQSQKISFHEFLKLSEEDLKALGIKLLGPRRKISLATAAYRCQNHSKKKL